MSPAAQTKSILDGLVTQLNRLISDGKPNKLKDFSYFKARAKKGIENDPVEAFSILGMVACIEQNIEDMHKNHSIALKYWRIEPESTRDYWAPAQYSISLKKSLLDHQAYYDYGKNAFDAGYESAEFLEAIAVSAARLDLNDEFLEFANAYERVTGAPHPLTIFPEDDDKTLAKLFDAMDTLIEEDPDFIGSFEPELIAEVEELIKGVELD